MSKNTLKQLIIDVIIAAILVAGVSLVVKPTIVRGDSMNTTLLNGDYLILNKLAAPDRGDIVVVETGMEDEKFIVKRVIAVGGDEIRIDGNTTYLNGQKLDEPYVSSAGDEIHQTWTIPEGELFVMGDNREVSLDSRDETIGIVNGEDVVGEVAVRLFPFDRIGTVK